MICGVGIIVDLGKGEGQRPLIIEGLVPGGAAAKKGPDFVMKGDEIVLLEGKDPKTMNAQQLHSLMVGAAGTPLNLKIKRNGAVRDVLLIREPIDSNSLQQILPPSGEESNLVRLEEGATLNTAAMAQPGQRSNFSDSFPTYDPRNGTTKVEIPTEPPEEPSSGVAGMLQDFVRKMQQGAVVCCSQRP